MHTKLRMRRHGALVRPAGPMILATAMLCGLTAATALAENAADHDWPEFRGHARDGVSAETGLLDTWPAEGPREVWRQPIGEGYSSITVVGDRFYTLYAEGEGDAAKEFAAAFDVASGKEIWRTEVGAKLDTQFGNGPRATPTVDGDVVYVLGSYGDLASLAIADGKAHWTLNLKDAFGSEQPSWGFSTSPLVDDDLLVVEGGGAEGKSYAGLDKASGSVRWTVGDGVGGPGYNSAIPVTMNGERRFVYVAGGKLRSIDRDGKIVWDHDWPRGETHAVPVFIAPDMIFASGAQGVGAQLLRVSEGEGKATVEELWKTDGMKNHFNASVVTDGVIYGFDNATFKAISVKTGEPLWAKRGLGKGSLILADGDLVVLSDRGKLLLVEATGDGFTEKSSLQALEGRSWTAPTLAGGRLYLRNHTEMVAFDLRGEG